MTKESTESKYRKSYEEKLINIIEEDEDMVIEIMLKRIEFAEGLDKLIQSRIKMIIDDSINVESVAKHILKDGLEERLEYSISEITSKKSAYEVYKKIKENSPEAADKRYYRAIKMALEKELKEGDVYHDRG